MTIFFVIAAAVLALLAGWKGVQVKEKAQNLKSVPSEVVRYMPLFQDVAARVGIPADILAAVAWVESNGDMNAIGTSGEFGVMQLKPIAIKDVQIEGYGEFDGWRSSAPVNVMAGASFLALMHKRTGNWPDAIRAYNQGQVGAIQNPDLAESYRQKVEERRKFF